MSDPHNVVLYDVGPDIASSACEQEPIHLPGAIQPHGAFLAAWADGLLVTHVSANLEAIFGRPAEQALGRPINDVLGDTAYRGIQAITAGDETLPAQTHAIRRRDGGTLHLHVYRSARHICVDIEPMRSKLEHEAAPLSLANSILKTFDRAASQADLMKLAVRGLRAITGYDRVMAYRFSEDGHGEVIAEDREASLEPYLGHHYPASDIPAQARRHYLRQRVGAIADSSYRPVPLLVDPAGDDGTPLDLTHSVLRSVSPLHRQFMRNMKTAASLTVGLANGQDLWGMLVCHHYTPRVAGPEVRAIAGMIGQVVSLMLGGLGQAEVLAQRWERNTIFRTLVDRLAVPAPLAEALAAAEPELLRLVSGTGALVRLSGTLLRLGHTPPEAMAERIRVVLQAAAEGEVRAVDDLPLRYLEFAGCAAEASGALLLPLAPGSDDAIMWFRPELAQTIVWGGNPTEHVTVDPVTGQLSPRASFAAWTSTQRGRSAPWTEADLSLAGELRIAVATEASRRVQAALRDTEARFKLLAEHSGDIIALNDVDGTRLYVSPAIERVLGWRPDEIVGRKSSEFVHPDDQEVMRAALKPLQGVAGESSALYRHRCRDGSFLWVEGRARRHVSDDGEASQGYVVVLRDATASRAAEIKLRDALARMEHMAATDALTGLANRRRLNDVADQEWKRCARERLPLSVLLLDADRFKLFNDHYGHLAGDDCLRAIAAQVDAAARRPGDLAARYGGEEFVLLMPNTPHDGARFVAERLRGLVQGLGIKHDSNAAHGIVTVSIGAATAWPDDPASQFGSIDALLTAADAALYRAKDKGRNQVCSASSSRAGR